MAGHPRLSVVDKLLNSTGFATIGRAVRESIVALTTTEETLQDVFTVFEYRHVHRDDWSNFCADVASRFKKLKNKVWPSVPRDSDATSSSLGDFQQSLRKEPELRLRTYPYMLFPLAPFKVLWDYAIMMMVAYNAVELPFAIAFDYVPCDANGAPVADGDPPKMCANNEWTPMMIFIDVMFWLDILLSFRTGIIDSRQVIHMQPKFAALHYARTWLLVDILSSFPFEAIVLAMSAKGASATFTIARLFKLPRLMRTARVIKNFHRLSKTTAFKLAYILFCTFTLAHWAACGFFFLARWEIDNVGANEFTGGVTWIEVPVGSNDPPRTYVEADTSTRYSAALYWAVTTMSTTGYGDILPMTNLERSYALIVMLVGVVVSALVFGVLGQIITDAFDSFASGAQSQNQLLAAVKELGADMRLDPALVRRAQETMRLQYHRYGGTHLATLLNTPEVSRSIREDVLMHVYGPALQGCEAFRDCGSAWLRALVQLLEPLVVLEGDAIFLAAELAPHLHILVAGTVILHKGGQVIAEEYDSRLLNGPEALDTHAVVQDQTHQYSASAHTNCELLVAHAADVQGLLRVFKADAAALSRFALQCHASRLALAGVSSPSRAKATAFAGIPEAARPEDAHPAATPGRHTAPGGIGRPLGGDARHGAQPARVDAPSAVAEPAGGWRPPPPQQAWSQHGSVMSAAGPAHGSVMSVRGAALERGSRAGDPTALDAGVAALMERVDEVASLQEQLCQKLVALSLQAS